MAKAAPPFTIVAEFAKPEAMLDCARKLREDGFRVEVYTPFPVDGLADATGFRSNAVPMTVLIAGAVGLVSGFLLQVWVNLAFRLDIGGRPSIAIPAFVPISFEVMILFAVISGVLAMLIANRLPRLHHPLFDVPDFGLASDDRFFVAVSAGRSADRAKARRRLGTMKPVRMTELPAGDSE